MIFGRKKHEPTKSEFIEKLRKTALYSFHGGLETFSNALINSLKNSDVEILTNSDVKQLNISENSVDVKINDSFQTFDRVYSSVPSWNLAEILRYEKRRRTCCTIKLT